MKQKESHEKYNALVLSVRYSELMMQKVKRYYKPDSEIIANIENVLKFLYSELAGNNQ